MRSLFVLHLMFIFFGTAFSQPLRIAILDFDNISGIAKYDGLGKAMSSMLISDIESNVSPKRLQLVERAQIQKILKEQNFQKSASFDKNTSVKMGKLLGVNFLLIGDIFILDNSLVINARLTDASTGDIKFSEKQEGKINEWLTVKTKLGKGVVTSISMPFTEPRIPDGTISSAVLTTYASAIEENDKGNYEKAETLISTAKEFNPDFGYLDDLKNEVEKLKKQLFEVSSKVNSLVKNPIELFYKLKAKSDTIQAYQVIDDAINNLKEDDPYRFNKKVYLLNTKAYSLIESGKLKQAKDIVNEIRNIEPFFMRGIITQLHMNAILKEYDEIERLNNFVIQNEDLFYSSHLREKSKLTLDILGYGYQIKSGFKAEEFSEREQLDLFILPFEFSNYIVSELAKIETVDTSKLRLYWLSSLQYISKEENFSYLINSKPFHFFKLFNNLLWASAKKQPKWTSGIKLEQMDTFFYSQTIEYYKSQLINNGFKPKDPFFTEDRYKDAFLKDWDYLNFRLNRGHVFYLNNQKEKAYEMYCNLIKDYDPQYVVYAYQLVKNFKQIILNDWKDLNLKDTFDETFCK
jgi:TolB-like protein